MIKPEDYNLSSDYVLVINSLSNFFYKMYQKMNYSAAKSQCESDGTLLAVPRSEQENFFIADLNSDQLWIGVNDLDEEGEFITLEGNLSYKNWLDGEPNNVLYSNGYDEDGVELNWKEHGYWNDVIITKLNPFVCLYRIPGTSKMIILYSTMRTSGLL